MPFPFDPDHYQQQLDTKVDRLQTLFSASALPELDVFASKPSHYRMRAEFRFWHDGDDCWYAMFNPADPKTPLRVDEFPVASRRINELMQRVRAAILGDAQLRHKLFQVEFLTTQTGDALITLLYHRKLDANWEARAHFWQDQWQAAVIGRARKQRLVLARDYVNETLNIRGRDYHFRQYENSFTQPNAGVCEQMVSWAKQHSHNSTGDLLELYCGNGNFSIPLAENFQRALGTEISRVSVNSAQHNIAVNQIDNLRIARMSSEDFSAAWLGQTQSRRLREWQIDDYNFRTLLVDPPRAGLDADTIALAKRFERIIYISCNPETLAQNVADLGSDYRIEAAALFDQFPYTDHMEAGLVLSRN